MEAHHAFALFSPSNSFLWIDERAVVDDLAGIIHPHPTLSETLGDVAAMFGLGATH